MNKYLRTLLLALQSQFTSFANLFGWLLVLCIPSIALVLVWLSILGQKESINGFSKGDFIIYYLFVTLGWYIVGGTFGRPLATGIKNGDINITLLKPYDAALSAAIREQAWKIVSFGISIPIIILVLYTFRDLIHINLTLEQIILLIFSLIFGGIIFAIIEALIGISAFWVTEVWPIAMINDLLRYLFGGLLVPLALVPSAIFFIANILPFKYIFYVPVTILLNKTPTPLLDIATQFLYIIILFCIYKFIWNLGLKKFEAVGA